jgi:hypothetical protein
MTIRLFVLVLTCALVSLDAVAQADTQAECPPSHWTFGGFQTFETGYFSGSAALIKHFGDLAQFPHFGGPIFSTQAEVAITRRVGVGLGVSLAHLSGRGPVADGDTKTRLASSGLQSPKMEGMIRMRFVQINPNVTFALISRKQLRLAIAAGPSIAWLDHIYRGTLAAAVATGDGPVTVVEGIFDKGRVFLPLTPRVGCAVDLKVKGPLHWHGSGSFNTFGIQALTGFALKF